MDIKALLSALLGVVIWSAAASAGVLISDISTADQGAFVAAPAPTIRPATQEAEAATWRPSYPQQEPGARLAARPSSGGGYVDASLAAARGVDDEGFRTDRGAVVGVQAGYALTPYFAIGARLEGYSFEAPAADFTGAGAFGELTLSTHRDARSYGYLAGGVGYVGLDADTGAATASDESAAASAELGLMINTGRLSGHNFELGPMVRYTYVADVFGSSVDVYQVGLRLGWNGFGQ